MLDERVRLIALTWLPANGGLINPAAAIGAVAREHGIAYFVDAAQAVGQLPIDVEQVGCDVLAGAGRKALRGPRGTGLLYVRRDFLPRLTPAWVDTHSAPLGPDGAPMLRPDAARLESAEASLALRCGLANALREALDIGLTRSAPASTPSPGACAPNWPRCPASRCWTKAASDRGWCRSMWRAWTRRQCSARWRRKA